MTVTAEWNWNMFCLGFVKYKNLKCFEIYIAGLSIGIWWGVPK